MVLHCIQVDIQLPETLGYLRIAAIRYRISCIYEFVIRDIDRRQLISKYYVRNANHYDIILYTKRAHVSRDIFTREHL